MVKHFLISISFGLAVYGTVSTRKTEERPITIEAQVPHPFATAFIHSAPTPELPELYEGELEPGTTDATGEATVTNPVLSESIIRNKGPSHSV